VGQLASAGGVLEKSDKSAFGQWDSISSGALGYCCTGVVLHW
jgi:hypothetical protein